MELNDLTEFQLLIGYNKYCSVTGQEALDEVPEWFEIDQLMALSIIYKNMTQTHIFPVDKSMFNHMKKQYQIMFIRALAWQIKYVNDNQELFDNPTAYLSSRSIGTFNRGALTQADVDILLDTLAPKAKFYLEQMGWLYKSLTDHYELDQFYGEIDPEDEYAKVSYVDEQDAAVKAYADTQDQNVKDWITTQWLQNKDGYAINTFLKVVQDAEGNLDFKWTNIEVPIVENVLQWNDTTKELFKGAEGSYTIVDDIKLGDATVLSRIASLQTDINNEASRATSEEARIESKVESKANDTEVVHVMPVPSSTTLTDEERNKITNGIFMNGTFLSMDNPVFYPAENTGGIWYGLVIGKKSSTTIFSIYKITSSNVISVLDTSPISIGSTGEVKVRNVADPTKDTDAANKKYVDEHIPEIDIKTLNSVELKGTGNVSLDEIDVYDKNTVDEKIASAEGRFLGSTQGTETDVATDEAATKFIGDYLGEVTITKNDYFNIELATNEGEQDTKVYRYISTGSKITIGEKEYFEFKFGFIFTGDITLLKSQVKANTTAITNEVSRATTRENEIEAKIPEIASEISETSTNEKPAGAKAVYDYIQSLNGNDIEY